MQTSADIVLWQVVPWAWCNASNMHFNLELTIEHVGALRNRFLSHDPRDYPIFDDRRHT